MSIATALCEAQASKDPVDVLVGTDYYLRGWVHSITNTEHGTFVDFKTRRSGRPILFSIPLHSVRGLHVDKVPV